MRTENELPQDLLDLHAKAMKMLEGIVSDYGVTFEQAGQIAQRVTDYHRPLWNNQLLAYRERLIEAVEGLERFLAYSEYDGGGVISAEEGRAFEKSRKNNAGVGFSADEDMEYLELPAVIARIKEVEV